MRVQAIYGCVGDHHDELTFNEGEVLVVLGEDDADWWVGTSQLQVEVALRHRFSIRLPSPNLFWQ